MKKIVEHSQALYDLLERDSEKGEDDLTVYRGRVTTLLEKELGLPNSYWSRITRLLQDMDCVRQLQRGARNSETVYVLLQRPTQELYEELSPEIQARSGRFRDSEMRLAKARITELEKQHEELKTRLDHYIQGEK